MLGRTAAALVVAGSIVGLTSWRPWAAQDGVVALAAHAGLSTGGQGGGTGAYPSGGSTMLRAAEGGEGQTAEQGGPSTKSRSGRGSEDQRVGRGRVPGSRSGATGPDSTSGSFGVKHHSIIGPSGRGGAAPRGANANALAAEVGAPPWKIDRIRQQLRGWHPDGVGRALQAVAEADAVCFTSSSTVTGFVETCGVAAVPSVVVCIGPVTSETMRDLGLKVDIEARRHDIPGLVDAIRKFVAVARRPARAPAAFEFALPGL